MATVPGYAACGPGCCRGTASPSHAVCFRNGYLPAQRPFGSSRPPHMAASSGAPVVVTNNPLCILQTLDRRLRSPFDLYIYGRSALALGFSESPAHFQATLDVDAILPSRDIQALEQSEDFWQAQQETNKELGATRIPINLMDCVDEVRQPHLGADGGGAVLRFGRAAAGPLPLFGQRPRWHCEALPLTKRSEVIPMRPRLISFQTAE